MPDVELFDRRHYGPTFTPTGQIRYTSVSQLKTAQRCLKKWWWEKVHKKPTPQTKAQTIGLELEDEWYTHLRTGKALSPMAFAGKRFHPPGKLLLQKPLATTTDDGAVTSPVKAGEVPLIGYIDILTRGRVIDIKTTSDPKWAKTPYELTQDFQMVGYSMFHRAHYKHTGPVPVQHWYFKTRTPWKSWTVDVEISPEQAAEAWAPTSDLITKMQAHVAVPLERGSDVPANTKACSDYGGCPHRSYCPEGAKASVLALFGSSPITEDKESMPQGKLSPAAQAALKELKAKQQQTNVDGIRAAHLMEAIGQRGWGTPPLGEGLATLYLQAKGLALVEVVPGTGKLTDITPITTLDDLLAIAREVDVPDNVRAWVPPTPETKKATEPAAPKAPPPAAPEPAVLKIVPPDAPETPVETVKRPVGRPRKVVPGAPAEPAHVPVAASAPVAAPVAAISAIPAITPVWALYINCMPLNAEAQSLYPYILKVWEAANKASKVPDLRLAEKSSPLAYGGWRGALSALVVGTPPEPGAYFIDTTGMEIAEVIAHALVQVVVTGGGQVVQGLR